MRDRWYIGLAATMHDPAMAIVDPGGQVVFAEAAERRLQDKRAYNSPPDGMIDAVRQVRANCPDNAELVVALNWSDSHMQQLQRAFGGETRHPDNTPTSRIDAMAWPFPRAGALGTALLNSTRAAGLNLLTTVQLRQPASLRTYTHHRAHAAHAVFTSPFEDCSVAVVDGFGETASCSFFASARGMLTEVSGAPTHLQPASLGFFYSRLCALCGFDPVQGEEWKVMGLAAYGSLDPELYELLRPLIAATGLALTSGCTPLEECQRVATLCERTGELRVGSRDMAALAHTGQLVFEETLTTLFETLHTEAPSQHLAYAGGCALNSSFNGRIVACTPFEAVHVPSAPADDGTAIGAALLAWCDDHPGQRPPRASSPYLGSRISPDALERLVHFGGLACERLAMAAMSERIAALLAEGAIVAWCQGAAEFGPRALGNRSILADPRPEDMKDRINSRIKFREEFRPFAPAILDAHGSEWFEGYQTSRYMERTMRFRPHMRDRVPAVVHEDGTGRAQSVRREWNPRFHELLDAFSRRSGVPILLNTSLNVMGRPIAHSVEDVVGMFLTTGLDALVIEDVVFQKGTR